VTHWSKLPKNEVGSAVDALIKDYKGTQVARKNRFLRNLELYELRKLGHLGGEAYYGAIERPQNDDPDRLRLVHSAIESVKASIYAPQKPKPQFQTLGATWAARRKAYFSGYGLMDTRVVLFETMKAGAAMRGPAIVESPFTTVVIEPGAKVRRTRSGSLLIEA